MKADTKLIDLSPSLRSLRIDTHEAQYRVLRWGRGPRTVVLLHGFTGMADVWITPTAGLDGAAQFIAPDLLGHGRTRAPDIPQRFSMQNAAADLIAILDTLHIGPVVLHGYSMGGRLALYIALTYPDRIAALSLESASPGLETDEERTARRVSDEALATRITRDGIREFVFYWEKTPLFAPQKARLPAAAFQRQREIRLSQRETGLAASLRGMGTGAQPSLWDELHTLRMPVHLMTGALDTKFESLAERMAARIPGARRQSVAAAGHAVHVEAVDAWKAALQSVMAIEARRA